MATTSSTTSRPLSPAIAANLAGLAVFGLMIVVQVLGGVDSYPTVPPGLVITVAVCALVVLGRRWWWTTLVALAWPVLLTIGAFLAAGSLEALSGDQGLFVQVTSIVQRAGLVLALVAGAVAVFQRYRPTGND